MTLCCEICASTKLIGKGYGVTTCNACKVFFRRTLKNKLTYKCKVENKCEVVSGTRRGCCSACRLQKCHRVGMRRDATMPAEVKFLPPIPSVCQVCGSLPKGINYGVLTCVACREFFRKTVAAGAKESNCKEGNQCKVTKGRGHCKPCRFRMCLAVGMQIEKVQRVGRDLVLKAELLKIELPKSKKSKSPLSSYPTPFFHIADFTLDQISLSFPEPFYYSWLLLESLRKPDAIQFIMEVASKNLDSFVRCRAHRNGLVPVDYEEEFSGLIGRSWIALHIFDIAVANGEMMSEYFLKNGEVVSLADIGLLGCQEGQENWKVLVQNLQTIQEVTSKTTLPLIHTMLAFQGQPEKIHEVQCFISGMEDALVINKVVALIINLSKLVSEHLKLEKSKGKFKFLDGKNEEDQMVFDLIG